MNYANLPPQFLNQVLGSYYNPDGPDKESTVKSELDSIKEDIVWVEYTVDDARSDQIQSLTVWTENHVGILIAGLFGEEYIHYIKRNPPALKLVIKEE